MAINFTDSPADGATQVISGRTYTYNSAKNKWDTTATEVVGPTAKTYATVNDLPGTALTGDQAFVSGTNRLYIWNGSGWYNIALVNSTPTWSTQPDSSYTLASDGTATTVTITATDPEGLPITYSIASDTSGNIATVTQSSNVFTITPSTNTANAGTFSLTFRASDGINLATAISEFTLAFKVTNSNYTTALITSVGTNNQVNNTFVDSSTNSHTITAVGNATQSTFSPYRHGGYSAKFNGTTSYFLTDDTSVIGTGDWTWEAWVRTTDTGGSLWMKYNGGNQADGISLVSGVVNTHTNVGLDPNNGSINIADGEWHYVVVERYNGTLKTFVDGTADSSVSNSENASRTGGWYLGRFGVSSIDWAGEIRDLRFSHNTAEYQGSFTSSDIPTETVTARASTTVILFTSDNMSEGGTATSMVSEPSGPYDYSEYASGDNGGSMYFDGTGDYLNAGTNASLALGSGDFTVECWIYPPTATMATYAGIYSNTSDGQGDSNALRLSNLSTSSTTLVVQTAASVIFNSTSNAVKVGQWNHVALVRNGTATNNMTLYVNGVASGQGTSTANFSTGYATIGTNVYAGVHYLYSGYIADVRVVQGTAVYTSAFTPPIAPLTAITNTSLLINGTNAGIIDKSQTAKTLTLNGDVKSSTTQTKYLTSSMYFDGTGDRIEVANSTELQMGTGDFTFEWWWYPTTAAVMRPICINGTGAGSWSIIMYANQTFDLAFATSAVFSSTISYSINTWEHIAIVRENSTVTCYVDGISQQSATNTTNLNATTVLGIGYDTAASSQAYQGYMSDVRITKGLARYTANFTPPTAALQG